MAAERNSSAISSSRPPSLSPKARSSAADGLFERLAVARPGDDGRLRLRKVLLRVVGQRRDEGIDAGAVIAEMANEWLADP